MRIVITGGAGCLGSNITEHFLLAGHDVLVIDNFATGHRESLPSAHSRMNVIESSIADHTAVLAAFRDFLPTHVIHSAAAYKDPSDWLEDARTNIEGTINVIAAAKACGAKRVIYFHTALGYGRPEAVPIPVTAPMRPFTSYGISKQAGENYLALSGLPFVSLRLANVTGPRLAIGPIPTFYKRLKVGQKCFCSRTVRDFIDMADFLAIVDLTLPETAPIGIFNVSTGTGHTVKEIFDIVVDHLGVTLDKPVDEVDPGPDDVPGVVLDPSHTIATFRWQPRFAFRETILRMLAWYDVCGVTAIYSHLQQPAGVSASERVAPR
jgi:UDP-glucose 4-epimerase